MTSLSNLRSQVEDHSQLAYQLATMAKRPPGYTVEDWALHLMNKTPDELKIRFEAQVAAERSLSLEMNRNPLFAGEVIIPAVPAKPPIALAAKAIQLYRQWLEQGVRIECEKAIAPLLGRKRSREVMFMAEAILRKVLDEIIAEIGFLPFTVKITMTADNQFQVNFSEKSR